MLKKSTINYIIKLLDTQYAHIAEQRSRSKAQGEQQRIHYAAMFQMANIAASEAFSSKERAFITVDSNGKHNFVCAPW